jgi:hypothetical protein
MERGREPWQSRWMITMPAGADEDGDIREREVRAVAAATSEPSDCEP